MEGDRTRKPDEYARGSFTWRRMTRNQIIGLIIALVAIIAAVLWWEWGT